MNTPDFDELIIQNGAKQIAFSFGINALKTQFYNFGQAPVSDTPDATSLLGTPVYDTLTFYGNGANGDITYYDINTKKTVTVRKLTLPVALCTVIKNVIIVKTAIAGRNGTVKQFINLGDYGVTIQGVFTSEIPDTRPEGLIRQLNQITSCPSEVNVASNFLSAFGITSICFEGEQTFGMDEGTRDVQKFSLNCVSETPFAIKVMQQGNVSSSNPFTSKIV